MKIIETNNLIKRFSGVHAVDHLSIKIESGQITGIIGPNGSGKTTLINLLSGVLGIDGGDVAVYKRGIFTRILSHQVSNLGITRTFQDVRIFEQMTVFDNLMVVVTERNVLKSLFEKRMDSHCKIVEEVLQKVGLWEKKDHLAATLSYGQRKLLEIARALAMNAEIYLFDEPFAGLYPEMRKNVAAVIQGLKQDKRTVILVEHDMSVIRELCDYIFVMDGGRLLAEGKPVQVLSKKEVIEAYLGE